MPPAASSVSEPVPVIAALILMPPPAPVFLIRMLDPLSSPVVEIALSDKIAKFVVELSVPPRVMLPPEPDSVLTIMLFAWILPVVVIPPVASSVSSPVPEIAAPILMPPLLP